MSRVYFHSQHGEAEISGRERHMGNWLSRKLMGLALEFGTHVTADEQHPLTPFLPEYLQRERGKKQIEAIETYMYVGFEQMTLPDGTKLDPFIVSLNTAWVMGSDPVKFLARLHGQCEIHCYVEGPNRDWLAGIIDRGLKTGIMRHDEQWEKVTTLLRSRNDEPVVTSYSVCEQFPNRTAAGWKPTRNYKDTDEPDWDQWYELPEDERWRLSLVGLRDHPEKHGLEMKPDNWEDFHFGNGETGYDIMKLARAAIAK